MSGAQPLAGSGSEAERELLSLLAMQREAARRAGILSYDTRRDALERLAAALVARKEAICDAIDGDFGGRSRHETLMAEVFTSVGALRYAAEHLKEWMRPQRRKVSWVFQFGKAWVVYQPLGVVGIIAPWNYPLFLTLSPLAAALAAGNRAMIKPSRFTPRLADLMAEMVADLYPAEYVTVIKGAPDIGRIFSSLPFDYMMFTGSPDVGRHVMRAASDHLCPVTLELGGKSPTIIAEDYSIRRAAPDVLAGKCLNGGQTCVAPDYLLLPQGQQQPFVEAARAAVTKMYPRLGDNPDYTSVIDERQYRRLRGYLEDARAKGATIIELNPASEPPEALGRKLPPTLLLDVTDEMAVMQEEIFGPLFPLVGYRDLNEAIDYINDRPRPLALYLFSDKRATVDRVINETLSGGVCINDTIIHVAQEDLPFGGVGMSGMGQYHGIEGFITFSKARPVFEQSRLNTLSFLRPPYGKVADRVLDLLLRR